MEQFEQTTNEIIKDITDLDNNFLTLPLDTITKKIPNCSARIKAAKKDLAAAIERLTKMFDDINIVDTVLISVCNKFRNMSNDIEIPSDDNESKRTKSNQNWADEMDENDSKKRSEAAASSAANSATPENVWLKRSALRAATEVIFRPTEVANSVYSIPAIHINNITEITTDKRFYGNICYVSRLKIFAFFTPYTGLVFGNGLICNPPGNDTDARRCTIMCSLRKRCKREECNYAHNPLDMNTPSEFFVLSSPHYNSRQGRNYRQRNGEIISSIPFFDVSDLDDDLKVVKYDTLHRFGRILMNFIIISAIIADRQGTNFMS